MRERRRGEAPLLRPHCVVKPMQLLVVPQGRTDGPGGDRTVEKSSEAGRNRRLCGRDGTAALKSASSGGGGNTDEFRFRSSRRSFALRRPEQRSRATGSAMHAASERAVDSTSIARQLLLPSPVRFILLHPRPRCLLLLPHVCHRGAPNLGRNSGNAASPPKYLSRAAPAVVRACLPPTAAPLVSLAANAREAFDGVNIWLRPH